MRSAHPSPARPRGAQRSWRRRGSAASAADQEHAEAAREGRDGPEEQEAERVALLAIQVREYARTGIAEQLRVDSREEQQARETRGNERGPEHQRYIGG